ncbi:uncharacterized protein MCYG_00671 [Microsporum canis CBS 113480]|uniref:Uncharacterized protein n=1 Tax=Arthroderma otae (strain ATCC MYA-4605 / CBS 113480) TaxID=554155 RepID=C5FD99_ARTOC|nr:uncharacterized protein MCYG_00671 [Microsporum canis CBS 113480]EEQ27783.1 predicted protein [Microsporum canis CBS 113480]
MGTRSPSTLRTTRSSRYTAGERIDRSPEMGLLSKLAGIVVPFVGWDQEKPCRGQLAPASATVRHTPHKRLKEASAASRRRQLTFYVVATLTKRLFLCFFFFFLGEEHESKPLVVAQTRRYPCANGDKQQPPTSISQQGMNNEPNSEWGRLSIVCC